MEGLALVAAAAVLPAWPRRIVAAVAGILFGLLALDLDVLEAAPPGGGFPMLPGPAAEGRLE